MFYLGMDVAKAKLDCCLLLDEASGKRKTKVVSNTKSGIVDLLAWVAKQNISPEALHVVMEGTGVYHEQAALALADAGVTVSIVNPAQVKDFGRGLAVRTKTDGVDSFVLARYGALLKPKAWVPPAPEARILQALLARRVAIAQDLQRERNRQEKADATDTPDRIQKSLADSIEFLVKQLAELQQVIDEHIDKHPGLQKDMALLQSIPAVGPQVGGNMLSVMHSHHFNSAEQLAAYLGWCRWSGSRAVRCWGVPGSPRRGLPEYALCCTWLPSWQHAVTRTSKPFMSACLPEANPRCPPLVPQCVSWCICALAYLKLNSHMSTIMQKMLDVKDGIYKISNAKK